MSLIEININNSFNKEKDDPNRKVVVGNDSTLNKNLGNHVEVNSINVTSLTNSVIGSQSSTIAGGGKRKTLIREIFIGVCGTVIGSIITFAIGSFFR